MKQYFLSLALIALVVTPVDSWAQETATTSLPPRAEERDARREEFREKRDAIKEDLAEKHQDFQEKRATLVEQAKQKKTEVQTAIKEKREALKTELQTIKKERLSARKTFVENRFSQVIVVLEVAQTKIGAKIDELKGKGYNMDSATDALNESKTSLAEAKTALEALKSATVSDTDETTATKPRELAKNVETLLQETRQHLTDAVKAMRGAIGEKDDRDETATTAQ